MSAAPAPNPGTGLSTRLASALGYDPDVTAELSAGQVRALAAVACGGVPAVIAVGASAAYGVWAAAGGAVLPALVGVGAGAYLWNLLRLSVAGGGVAPHEDLARAVDWSPRVVVLAILALLGFFFAQPLVLWGLRTQQDPAVQRLRASLVSMHEQAVVGAVQARLAEARAAQTTAQSRRADLQARMDATARELAALDAVGTADGQDVERRVLASAAEDHRSRAVLLDRAVEDATREAARWETEARRVLDEDVAAYTAHLGRSHFLLRRVQLTWEHPAGPLLMSLGMVWLMLLPWLLSATAARRTIRAYEATRRQRTRALVDAAHVQLRAQLEAALRHWNTFGELAQEPFEDAPYNTRPRPEFRRWLRAGDR